MEIIHIFGHKKPDTDSICSTIAYANLKKKLGYENVVANRLGEINKETEYVLNYFNVEEPKILTDLDVKIGDLNLYEPNKISKHDPIKKAWDILKTISGSRIIPAVDKSGVLEGILSIGDITKLLMEVSDENVTQKYEILFDNFLNILDAEVKYGEYKFRKIEGRLIIGSDPHCYGKLCEADIVVTSRIESAKNYLNDTNCGCIIVTNGHDVSELSNSKKAIVPTKNDIFKVVSLINQSISMVSVMNSENLITISTESTVEDILNIMKTSTSRNFPVIGDDNKLVGIISRRHIIDYPKKKVILIDHNERGQSANSIENAQILEIIDHHRVADVQTETPLYVRSEPVGCTSTIIYKMYKENEVEISKEIAGIMLSAIISDTLMFSSPTCTEYDKKIAEILAKKAEININVYAKNMLKAGTSINGLSFDKLLNIDCKAFTMLERQVYVSQLNTLDLEEIENRMDECVEALRKFCENNKCDLAILMVTDILNCGSKIIIEGKFSVLAEKAFGIELGSRTSYLEGVVSRKKQVIPKLISAIKSI